jgi:hypothetical protein
MVLSSARPRWTLSVLTIPQREAYLAQLLQSLSTARLPAGTIVDVVYNWDTRERPFDVERRVRRAARGLDVRVHFNTQRPTIGGGRIQQLNHCKTPLVAFIDDDITVHGDVLGVLESTLRTQPVGVLGVQSLVEGSDRRFKPRRSTPRVSLHGLRFMPVQGMLVAGYRRLFLDVGGFNPRREFWGEWTEFNLRLWRHGFASAYVMNGAYLRHWEAAPNSPTRNMTGREDHVLWGLLCTALEYDAVDDRDDTEAFWHLVETRYLRYAFGENARMADLMRAALRLAPRLSAEYPAIARFRDAVREHPFDFKPFHQFAEADVRRVLRHAESRIAEYRDDVWDSAPVRAARWFRSKLAAG